MANKVFIFVPAFGQNLTATTFLTTHALRDALAAKGIVGGISTISFPDIAELRSMVTTIWYDTLKDSSHLLFVDSDMGFPPQLVLDMITFGEPLVGTIYPQRKLPLSWAGSGTGETHAERRGDFMKVEGVGMGCTLIHRSVIDKMIEAFPEMIDTRISMHPAAQMLQEAGCSRLLRFFDKIDIAERGQVSEDLSFCMRWNKIGGQTWAAIGHKISHVGYFDYCGRYLDTVEALQKQEAEALAQSAGGTTVSEPLQVVEAPSIVPDQMPPPGANRAGSDDAGGGMKGREFPIPRQFCHEYEIPYWEDNLANPDHCMILGAALAEAQRAALEEAKRYRAMRSDRDGRA